MEGATAYFQFSKAQTEAFGGTFNTPKSYPWVETGETLQSFVNQARARAGDGFSLTIDRNTPQTSSSNPWGLKLPNWTGDKSFVRTVDASGQKSMTDLFFKSTNQNEAETQSDEVYDAQDEKIEDEVLSNTDFLFRRRRSNPPPSKPVQIQPAVILTNTFKITFFAKELRGIFVAPATTWFNRGLLQKYGPQLGGWWGPNGAMSLLPKYIYVAYQPRVEIVISESQVGALTAELNKQTALAWLVGGAHFKGYTSNPMSDVPVESQDRVFIEELSESEIRPKRNTTVLDKLHKRHKVLSENEETESENEYPEADESKYSEETDFLFRRRRRAPPPPPPPRPPPPKVERNFKIVFESKSTTPQIIGVVSEILP